MERWSDLWDEHKGKIVGLVVGLVVGVFILRYGFWRTLFVASLVAAGFWIGALVDREGWAGAADRVAGLLQRRR